jgi:hypothetical protein
MVAYRNTPSEGEAYYYYDADGALVRRAPNATAWGTAYVGEIYEKVAETGTVTKYYFAAGQRIAMRKGSALYYLTQDHLGGTACDIGAYEAGGTVPTPPPTTPTATPLPSVLMADADCSGTIQTTDALWVLRFAAAMTPYAECLFAANANCDLRVDAVDALLILRYVADLPVSQPPGCPKIGPPP